MSEGKVTHGKAVLMIGGKAVECETIEFRRNVEEPEPFKIPDGMEVEAFPKTIDVTLSLRGPLIPLPLVAIEPAPEQVVAEIKAEISKRIAALPKADFNAAAEVVGAVLNEYIDRGVLLDDDHALTEDVADVLDGVTG